MNKETREWEMVCDLMGCRDDMTEKASNFITKLHMFLDPYLPFREQVEGDPEKQEKWLHSLYERHMNEDEEAADDIWDN